MPRGTKTILKSHVFLDTLYNRIKGEEGCSRRKHGDLNNPVQLQFNPHENRDTHYTAGK